MVDLIASGKSEESKVQFEGDRLSRIVAARKVPISGVAILGSHPQTVETAPFDDEGWLIFACSPHNIEHRTLPRWDMWSEIHQPAVHKTRTYDYLRRLEKQAQEKEERGESPIVWMRDQTVVQHFPGGMIYPEADMKKLFCPFMFTSSIAFMLAASIVICERLNVKQIGLWGILQASEAEFAYQRPGTQYFLWEATKRGIKVLAAKESRLFELPEEIF